MQSPSPSSGKISDKTEVQTDTDSCRDETIARAVSVEVDESWLDTATDKLAAGQITYEAFIAKIGPETAKLRYQMEAAEARATAAVAREAGLRQLAESAEVRATAAEERESGLRRLAEIAENRASKAEARHARESGLRRRAEIAETRATAAEARESGLRRRTAETRATAAEARELDVRRQAWQLLSGGTPHGGRALQFSDYHHDPVHGVIVLHNASLIPGERKRPRTHSFRMCRVCGLPYEDKGQSRRCSACLRGDVELCNICEKPIVASSRYVIEDESWMDDAEPGQVVRLEAGPQVTYCAPCAHLAIQQHTVPMRRAMFRPAGGSAFASSADEKVAER